MKSVLTIIFLFCMLGASGQEYGTVKGKVVDANDGEDVILAKVIAISKGDSTLFETQTNFDGEFILDSLLANSYRLFVSRIAYDEYRTIVNVWDSQNVYLNIKLSKGENACPSLHHFYRDKDPLEIQTTDYSREEIQRMPYR